MEVPVVILASGSQQRKLLMDSLGIEYQIRPANIDEQAIQNQDASVRAQLVAREKAREIARQWQLQYGNEKPAVIIAADTFGYMDGKMFEKPVDKGEAFRMMSELAGNIAVAITGVCILTTANGEEKIESVETTMKIRELSTTEIERYVSQNEVTKWSGGFSPAYHHGAALFESIDGSLTSFTHGFPMEVIVPALREAGVEL